MNNGGTLSASLQGELKILSCVSQLFLLLKKKKESSLKTLQGPSSPDSIGHGEIRLDVTVGWQDVTTQSTSQQPAGGQCLPTLHPSTKAGTVLPWLCFLEVSWPLWDGDGTPNGLLSCECGIQTEFLLPAASVVSRLEQTGPSLQHLSTRGGWVSASFPRGGQPQPGSTQNGVYSQARLWQHRGGRWRQDALFMSPNNAPFFNLFRFFAALQHFCLVFSLRSITSLILLCRTASLPASPCIYLAFLPLSLPCICSVEPCTCLGEHPPVFPGSISNQDCFAL